MFFIDVFLSVAFVQNDAAHDVRVVDMDHRDALDCRGDGVVHHSRLHRGLWLW